MPSNIRLEWKSEKHSSLLRYGINEKFYDTGRGVKNAVVVVVVVQATKSESESGDENRG